MRINLVMVGGWAQLGDDVPPFWYANGTFVSLAYQKCGTRAAVTHGTQVQKAPCLTIPMAYHDFVSPSLP
jgi:acyl-[acyl carrier protein]--UDP-N-acetylglucosamine O-acyltransferase